MKLNRGAADIAMQYPKISAQILWVDDEQAIRQLGKLMMKRLGHLIDTAKGGEEALEFLGKKHYDLLITDVGMPGMSGWQLAKNIKGKYMDLKVAIVSGWGDVTSEKKRTECGVGYVLGKPTGIKELQNLIGEALQSMN